MRINKNLISRAFLLMILLVILGLLASGGDFLLIRIRILMNFHMATLLAWLGLVVCSLLSISINRNNQKLAILSSVSFYLSIFWLLISYLLAGNANFIFSDSRLMSFYIWLVISLIPVFSLLISSLYNMAGLFMCSLKKN